MLNDEVSFSQIAKGRPYSKFLCQEMLYDFLRDRLDPERKKAVLAALDKHEDLRKQKRSLEAALKYCSELTQCDLGESFINKTMAPLSVFEMVWQKMSIKRWPVPLKWGLEALVVSALVATIALVVFWSNIQSMIPVRNETVLVQQKIKKDEFNVELTDKKEIADFNNKMSEEAQNVVTVEPLAVATAEAPKVEAIQKEIIKDPIKETPKVIRKEIPKEAPKIEPAPVATVSAESKPISEPVEAVVAAVPPPTKSVAPAVKPKGYVYKLVMKLANLEVLGPEIAEKIIAMGAIKAGEVEIGWRKPNGNYYHFVIEKERGAELAEMLKTYGTFQAVKDPHTRVMPENQDRYILWIEDK